MVKPFDVTKFRKNITKSIDDVSSKLLYASLVLKNDMYKDPEKDYNKYKQQLETLSSNMKSINDYESKQVMMKQNLNRRLNYCQNKRFPPKEKQIR